MSCPHRQDRKCLLDLGGGRPSDGFCRKVCGEGFRAEKLAADEKLARSLPPQLPALTRARLLDSVAKESVRREVFDPNRAAIESHEAKRNPCKRPNCGE